MIPAAPQVDFRDDIQITVGTVKATDTRAFGGTVHRDETHANLQMEQLVWLEDSDGKEHAFSGGAFSDAREGHVVAVVQRRSTGKTLRVYNQATRKTTDLNDLVPMSSDLFWNTVALVGLLFIPAFVISITIEGELRAIASSRGVTNYTSHVMLDLLILVPTCRWLVGRLAAISQTKVNARAKVVDALYERHQADA